MQAGADEWFSRVMIETRTHTLTHTHTDRHTRARFTMFFYILYSSLFIKPVET